MLFEDTPFFTALELASLAVLPSVDGVAHGRHFAISFLLSQYKQIIDDAVAVKREKVLDVGGGG